MLRWEAEGQSTVAGLRTPEDVRFTHATYVQCKLAHVNKLLHNGAIVHFTELKLTALFEACFTLVRGVVPCFVRNQASVHHKLLLPASRM